MNDERNERIRKRRKKLKKANQKEKRASIDDNGNNVDGSDSKEFVPPPIETSNSAKTRPIPGDLAKSDEAKPIIEPNENFNKDEEEVKGVIAARNHVKEPDTTCETDIPENEALSESEDKNENIVNESVPQDLENIDDEVVNENNPEFIGPKLPP